MKLNKLFLLVVLVAACVACETALEENLSGKKPVLLAPVNNLVTIDTMHTFYWERMDGADEYQLQLVSPRFDSIVQLIVDTTINGNTFTMDLNPKRYQWRVKAINSGSESDFSDIWNLEIQ